jgi:hypothetical protein
VIGHVIYESIHHFAARHYEDIPMFSSREFHARTPRPLVSPYGPNYSMHPELSRPVTGIVTATLAPPIAFVGVPVVLAAANMSVIEDAPEEKQRGLWLMFSSALTGTFGGDYSGLV